MTHDEAFLQAILESPDDDTPRLVYADWLDEHGDAARGEFIRVQCELAQSNEDDPRWLDLVWRERCLLLDHQVVWLGTLRPSVTRWTFRRGFLDEIAVRVADYVQRPRLVLPPTVRHVALDLKDAEIPAAVIELVPESVARENVVLPVGIGGYRELTFAMADASDRDTIEKLAFIFNRDIEPLPADADQIRDAIDRHYGGPEFQVVGSVYCDFPDVGLPAPVDERPIARLVSLIFREAVALHATEIRVEPESDRLVVRYRIDGEWVERDSPPRRLHGQIVNRIRSLTVFDAGGAAGRETGVLPRDASDPPYFRVVIERGPHGLGVSLAVLETKLTHA
jgi:uncharacterized protein (TIGR02996 family)